MGAVFELLLAGGLVVVVFLVTLVPWHALFVAGLAATGLGLVFGVVTGAWYHVLLARALAAVDALCARWWLRPVALHARLDAAALRPVMPWFYAGAAGFVVTVAGIVLIALAMAVGVWRAP
jgi:hypothetical protein